MHWNRIQTVVVPVDLERPDPGSLHLALEAASSPDAHVHVLYVLPRMEPSLVVAIDDRKRIANAHHALTRWLGDLHLPASPQAHVVIGAAADSIADLAASLGADLIILRSRGHRGAARWLMGSVAERAVRLSPCPVLVLH